MTLPLGSRLGPYEIVSPLGVGGMGEVYRARDTRLERTVAIKVLPGELAGSPERRARLEREAKAVSALSHPHICTLYDIGREDGVDYLVLEYLEGETLADRLTKGAVPLEQALRIGSQIADALGKAHRAGIVHRDVKPGNIMLTKSGPKLLDFGLARLHQGIGRERPDDSELTKAKPLTEEGALLGTFQYMAPEQLEGKDADERTDIWALGLVLYEMVTGQKAFTGKSQASLIGAILKEEPAPLTRLQPMTPPALDRLVRTCLAKDPEERRQSASDLRSELQSIADERPPTTAKKSRERWAWAIAAGALVLAAASLIPREDRLPSPETPSRLSIVLPDLSSVRAAVLSPDGSKITLVARDSSGRSLLWIRALDSLAVQPLAGTEDASFPFWSPDGRFIAFFADGKLKKIDATGGPPMSLCDAPLSRGGTWSREGVILFAPNTTGPLFRVSASGGLPTQVTRFEYSRDDTSHRWPFFLPDGRRFLYLKASFGGPAENTGIYVGSLDSEEETLLLRANSSVAYADPGYVLFFREGNLLAQRFDARTLRITGDPFPVVEEIQYFPQVFSVLFSGSENGRLLYQPRAASDVSQLVWFDRNGNPMGTLGPPSNQANPQISPQGTKVAVDIIDSQTGNTDVWVYESSGGLPTRFTSHRALEVNPVWSPDGGRIVFTSLRENNPELHEKSSSGAGGDEAILRSPGTDNPTDWSPDGRFILYRTYDATSNLELWVVPVDGDRTAFPFLEAAFRVSEGQFSPDGHWVAYSSNESGESEVYVTSFPAPERSWRVSSAGGSEPRWRRDGKELYYLASDRKLMAVDVQLTPTFEAGVARPLFQARPREHIASTDLFSYDVSPDGQRFLINTDVGEATSPPLTIVLNWTAGLKP